MEVKFKDIGVERIKTELLVLPVMENQVEDSTLRLLDRRLGGGLSRRIRKSQFTGAEGTSLLHATGGALPAAYLLLVGMGKGEQIEMDSWRKAGARARKETGAIGAEDIGFHFVANREPEAAVGAVVEGALLASYQFNKYRSNSKPAAPVRTLTLFRPGLRRSAAMERAASLALDLSPGVYAARDLVNEPPSVTTARYLAEQARQVCRGRGLGVEVWGKKKIQAMNLAGLLAVNRGSAEEPRFIIIRYKPSRARKKVVLIGKGITFDSGGLSLKPAKSMETMKLDMAGGAAIIGSMSRLPYLRPEIEVTGYIPTTDNLPSGSAQKPGDIIR
ncbi:MAG: leucyl aminopeptidase, partial [Deltaproteobacteria bacterium]|nr:leucyl aminopeptidase [Deltaproteobacteria bacterium]